MSMMKLRGTIYLRGETEMSDSPSRHHISELSTEFPLQSREADRRLKGFGFSI